VKRLKNITFHFLNRDVTVFYILITKRNTVPLQSLTVVFFRKSTVHPRVLIYIQVFNEFVCVCMCVRVCSRHTLVFIIKYITDPYL
jgi:hypothetical protein